MATRRGSRKKRKKITENKTINGLLLLFCCHDPTYEISFNHLFSIFGCQKLFTYSMFRQQQHFVVIWRKAVKSWFVKWQLSSFFCASNQQQQCPSSTLFEKFFFSMTLWRRRTQQKCFSLVALLLALVSHHFVESQNNHSRE